MNKKLAIAITLLMLTIGCNIPRQADSTLKVELKPSDAKVKVTALDENQDAVRVKIEVKDYGTFGPKFGKRLKNRKSLQVGVVLKKPGFLTQEIMIYKPVEKVTTTLIPFSLEKNRAGDSVLLASKTYNLKMAYPTYIPDGFEFDNAGFQGAVDQGGSHSMISFQWSKDGKKKRGRPTKMIGFRFMAEETSSYKMIGPSRIFSTIKIDKDFKANLSRINFDYYQADFIIKGKEANFTVDVSGLPEKEFIKIIKGIKLAPNDGKGFADLGVPAANPFDSSGAPVQRTRLDSIDEAGEKSGLPLKVPERLFGAKARAFLSLSPEPSGQHGVMIVYSKKRDPVYGDAQIYVYPNPGLQSYDYIMDQPQMEWVHNTLRKHKGLPGYVQKQDERSYGELKSPATALVEWSDNGIIYMVNGPVGMELDELIPIADSIE